MFLAQLESFQTRGRKLKMPPTTQQDLVTINLTWSKQVGCTTQVGRISSVDLVFKDTEGSYPLPALHLVAIIQLNGEEVVYEQALGTQYPHSDHSSEHTHNQITALMRLCRVRSWNDIAGQPVLVLRSFDDPGIIYGLSDIEQRQFCHQQEDGLVLVWDE